jgi:hypothetical protein
VLIVSVLAELGPVADGGRVADPEQMGGPERIAAGGAGFAQQPASAKIGGGDAGTSPITRASGKKKPRWPATSITTGSSMLCTGKASAP